MKATFEEHFFYWLLRTSSWLLVALTVQLTVRAAPTFSDANWTGMGGFPGTDSPVRAAAVDASGNLYIGGDFTFAGETNANYIAKWNGSNWSALRSGIGSDDPLNNPPSVRALAVLGGDLYVGGRFTRADGTPANNIAKWNGIIWSWLGSGMNGLVAELIVSGGVLYAGGTFTTAGGIPASRIAKWNGINWSAVGAGVSGGGVGALVVSGSDLYAGGSFTNAGGITVNRIAKWDGTNWSALGSGMVSTNGFPASVSALTVLGGDLYAGGLFTSAGNSAAHSIAKWDGSSWSDLGSGIPFPIDPNVRVNALVVSSNDLYVGGWLYTAGGTPVNHIAKWNGSSWSAVGAGMEQSVSALAMSGSNLYAGGTFTIATNNGGAIITATHIAKWDGTRWSALGSGMNIFNSVSTLAAVGGDLYAGGYFTADKGANYVAMRSASNWLALGSGIVNPSVAALAVSGSDLYVGGRFMKAGDVEANNIAKWNGSSWSALSSGLGRTDPYVDVYALAASGSDVYAGGYFTTAGGTAVSNIAKWNGSSWSPLGPGLGSSLGGYVLALAVSRSDLYAGGLFLGAGGTPVNNVAKWNGSSWSPLGSGIFGNGVIGSDPRVHALAVLGGELYAGGGFTNAGGNAVNRIAKWNGTNWSALGAGVGGSDPHVYALAVSGIDLYVGGKFTTAGGTAASNIARWDGSSWSALGSGVGGEVDALTVLGSDLYAGGYFWTAGGKVSVYVAKARIGSIAKSIMATNSTASIQFSGVTGYQYDVQRTADVAPPVRWTYVTPSPISPTTSGSFTFTDTNPPSGKAFYRAVQH